MEDIILNFFYKGQEVKMQCKRNENMNDIFKRYSNKINKDINNIYFINNGKIINKNNIKLEEIDNKDNAINILVYDINNNNERIISKQYKDIICPKCGENCLIEIKDYKINLNKCDNKHNTDNILLDEYNNSQIKEEIKYCDKCFKNKSEIYDNKIYKCYNCNINLCYLCKYNHNKEHTIIDYELINYICKIHGERYISYCKECEKNICDICELEHNNNHNIIYHKEIIKNKDNNLDELKIKIDQLKNEIKEIINKLNKIINNIDIYFNINKNIFNNNIKYRNYQILINKNNMNEYNVNIINDIDKIIKEYNINKKFKYLYEIYNKMTNNNKIYFNGKYIGDLKNDKREGNGIMYYNDGDKYEGEFKSDKREGKGIYYYKEGDRYEGDFKNGLFEGKGIYYYNDGDREIGNYLKGKKIAKHATLHSNGDITSTDYYRQFRL